MSPFSVLSAVPKPPFCELEPNTQGGVFTNACLWGIISLSLSSYPIHVLLQYFKRPKIHLFFVSKHQLGFSLPLFILVPWRRDQGGAMALPPIRKQETPALHPSLSPQDHPVLVHVHRPKRVGAGGRLDDPFHGDVVDAA